jgi:tetratricopeptide (TPR) repeat protein
MKKFGVMRIIFKTTLIVGLFLCATAAYAKVGMLIPDSSAINLPEQNSFKALETIMKIKESIAADPEDYELYEKLAFVYDYLAMYKESLEALKKELEYYPGPDWHALYYNIARAYMNIDDLKSGKEYLDKAMEYKPDDIYNNSLLLDYSILTKDYGQAAIQMKKLTDLYPENDWYQDTFTRFFKLKDKDAYIALYTKALELNPNNHYAIRAHALMLRNQGKEQFLKNYDFIIKELKRAYRLKPDYVFHCVGIGNTYLWKWAVDKDKKNLNRALEWMKRAYKIDQKSPQVLYCLGNIYLYMDQADKTIEYIEKSINCGMDKEDAEGILCLAYNNKAYNYYKKGKDFEKGIELIDKALISNPGNGIFLGTKAELLYKMKRYEEAYAYITKGIALVPGNQEMEQDLINIKQAMGEKQLK